MRLGSLCSGYGGLDLAVEHHYGATTVWHSEVDEACSKILAHHWPGVPNLGDLTAVDWNQVEPIDILCAGFPCQPFSTAGEQRGSDDERAIFPFIADALRVLRPRPRIVVLENVSAIAGFAHGRGGGLDVVGTLAGLGYVGRAGIVRASDAGAPHRRARWFAVATDADDSRQPLDGANDGAPDGRRYEGSRIARGSKDAADAAALGPQGVRASGGLEEESGEPRRLSRFGHYEPAVRRWERVLGRQAPDPTDDRGLRPAFVSWMMGLDENHVCGLGLSRTAELKALGNGVVPQQALLALALLNAEERPEGRSTTTGSATAR